MSQSALFQRWPGRFALVISLSVVLVGCATVPRQYVRMAEPGVTLTELTAHPESYRGKVVLLGGTIVGEEETAEYLWLHVKNRPLDQDYVPHRPVDMDGTETGHYWVVMPKQQIPREYRQWARMTVVGRVTGMPRSATEPVLLLFYVRGWGINRVHDAVWADSSDPNYVPSVPAGLGGEFKGALQ
jgi:starvation-inducible outer membrane lipoprotein